MNDRVFSGIDVEAAVRAAAAFLGVAADSVRYVVLEEGTPGVRGLKPTPARIAVLSHSAAGPEAGGEMEEEEEFLPEEDFGEEVERLVAGLAMAAGAEIRVEVLPGREGTTVRVQDPGRALFLDEEGEALRAFDHLVARLWARFGESGRVRVECDGYREHRDAQLRRRALRVGEEVRSDGQPRRIGPLNAYERRIVHVAISEMSGLRTFSVGEGAERSVTVAVSEGPADA